MKNVKSVKSFVVNPHSIQMKYYIYSYSVNGVVKYIGKGSDGTKKYKRSKDIKTHNKDCILNSQLIEINIIEHYDDLETSTMNEAAYIKFFNLVSNGWNKREELVDNKFYSILETIGGKSHTIASMIEVILKNSDGSSVVEPDKLSNLIISKLKFKKGVTSFIGNDGFGGTKLLNEYRKINKNKLEVNFSKEGIYKMITDGNQENILLRSGDYLESPTEYNSKDLIIMNPPWTGIGIEFIDKSLKELKDGGKLVCIMGRDAFSPNEKSAKKPGTYWDLLQRGSFESIEIRRHENRGEVKKGWFDNAPHVWFIFVKGEKGKTFTVSNTLREEFKFTPTGKEYILPSEPFEKTKDYIDWDNGVSSKYGSYAKPSETTANYTIGVEKLVQMIPKGSSTRSNYFGHRDGRDRVDPEKLKSFLDLGGKRFVELYGKHMVAEINFPPIKRELICQI